MELEKMGKGFFFEAKIRRFISKMFVWFEMIYINIEEHVQNSNH